MRQTLVLLLISGMVTSCSALSPAAQTSAPAATAVAQPPLVQIGTPLKPVMTPELQALTAEKTDQQMLIEFLVTPDGQVRDPKALFSGLSPADTQTALQAFQQWDFKPAHDGRKPVERQFIYPLFFGPDALQDRTRFFCRNQSEVYAPDSKCEVVTFGRWRIYRMDPVYPAELLTRHLAGTVTLSFDIGKRGQALDPKVVSAEPPELFDAAALTAVKQWYFEPIQETQKDPPPEHVTVTVKFTSPSSPAVAASGAPPPPVSAATSDRDAALRRTDALFGQARRQ